MPNKPITKPIEIFRRGTHTAMDGSTINFTAADVRAIASGYDPAKFHAPLVVGHPKTNGPAYGWVDAVSYNDATGIISVKGGDVEAQFADLVNERRFKRISASLFPPDHPDNPTPGDYYLRHVGFLGAAAPAVKGLKDAEFGDHSEGVIAFEFGAADDKSDDSLIRKFLREFAGMLKSTGANEQPAGTPATTSEEDTMSDADKTKQAAEFARREKELSDREAAIDKRLKDFEAAEKRDRVAAAKTFVDGLIAGEKVLPKRKNALVAAFAAVDGIKDPVEFAEGEDEKKSEAPGAIFRLVLGEMGKTSIALGKQSKSTGGNDAGGGRNFSAPENSDVDTDATKQDARIRAYAAKHKVPYFDAAIAVEAGAE